MRRRDFVGLSSGLAVWPLAARGQQERMQRIGMLMTLPADDPEAQRRVAAFVQELQRLGWTEGRNMRLERRWDAGDPERARKYSAELVGLTPDVVLAPGSVTVAPLLQLTRSIPIVFVHVPDPVGAGYVTSLAHPGGMPPALPSLNSARAASGWNCSRRLRPASPMPGCCAIRPSLLQSASSRPYRS